MKRVFAIPILFFLTLIFYLYFVAPELSQALKQQNTFNAKQNAYATRQQYFEQIRLYQTKLKDYTEVISKIDTALPSIYSMPELFYLLQGKTLTSGLILGGISPVIVAQGKKNSQTTTNSSVSSGLQEHLVNLSVSGSFSAFEDFVGSLEVSSRLINIERLSITQNKESGLDMAAVLKVYSY